MGQSETINLRESNQLSVLMKIKHSSYGNAKILKDKIGKMYIQKTLTIKSQCEM